MRVRKVKNAEERLSAQASLLLSAEDTEAIPFSLSGIFPGFKRFRLEIGCGKGAYVCGEAENHPDVGYIAVEKVSAVIVFAAEKVSEKKLANVRLMNTDALMLPAVFPKESFERIHINFCDPWPKARHAKRRLTNRFFLEKFASLLTKDGFITFKTDNADLFEYSLPEFEAAGYEVRDVTHDLHSSSFFGCDTETEYEKAFSEKGTPICRLEAVFIGKKAE